MSRVDDEVDLVRARFPTAEVDPHGQWVLVPDVALPTGWSMDSTPVLVEVPQGYPSTPPDNFYTSPDLKLASGAVPANTSGIRVFDETPWLQFSFHVEAADWRPHAEIANSHTLVTYLEGVLQRLEEVE